VAENSIYGGNSKALQAAKDLFINKPGKSVPNGGLRWF
jgi:hypothetical protein